MENHARKGESLGYFNLARGLGILLIVIGHSVNPLRMPSGQGEALLFGRAGSILGGGIIAAFFMISGFGFYRRSPQKCLKIQTKLLLRPYAMVAAAVLITKLLLALVEHRSFRYNGGELVLTYLLGLNAEGGGNFLGIPIESVSILWFVLALFGGWIIYNGCMRISSSVLRGGIITGCVVLSYLLTFLSKVWPFCLPMALLAVGYLAAGDWFRKKQILWRKLPWWTWGILFLSVLICAAFGEVNIVAGIWHLGLLDVWGSFCAGFLLLRLYTCIMEKDWHGPLVSFLEEIGFRSIWIVCLHAYEKIIFPWYRIYGIFSEQPWLAVLICFAGRCGVMYIFFKLIMLIRRTWKKKERKKKITIEI